MKTNTFSNCLIYIDSNAHYIPMIGTIVALVGIFEKRVVLPFMHEETITNSHYFSYISNKSTGAFLLACVPILGSILIYLSGNNSDYTKDQDSLLKAMDKDVAFLQHADENLRKNAGFMMAAIKEHPFAMEYAHLDLKKDQDFMLKAMEVRFYTAMKHADPSLKSNQAFILKAMEIDFRAAMEHIDPSLKSNQAFILKAMEIDFRAAMEHIDPSLKINIDFLLGAVKILGANDYNPYYQDAFSNDLTTIMESDPSLKSDQGFMLKAMEINFSVAMKHIDSSLKKDQAFMLEAMKINFHAIMEYIDFSLKGDQDFMLEAMKIDFRIVKYISEDLKSDDNFMWQIVLQKPQARTSSGDSIINSIINLDKLHLAPPLMEIPSSIEANIMELSTEFNELTKDEVSKYEDVSKSDYATENERNAAQKKLQDLNLEREKLAILCRTIQSGPAEGTSNFTKLFHKQLSLLLKNIIGQWESSKGLEYKDKNLRALADVATRCEPTWLEEATRIYSELDRTGTPQAKLLTLVQKYKEATILQLEQEGGSEWHALSKIRKAHGKNLGLNTDLAELDMYINTGMVNISTEWSIKALWDAPSLLESVHTALSIQEYDRSLYDFLLEITKKKNYVTKGSCDEEEHELKINEYIAENFYDEDYKFKPHGVHVMLVDIGVLEAV